MAGVLVLVCLAQAGLACTAFLLRHNDELVYGRNYDWSVDEALIITNKRGIAKTAMADSNPAQWTSKYGSVTFNQFGREQPLGGMNEKGLVVATLWLDETVHRPPGPTPELNSLQWVQYQLDNCALVREVLASDSLVRIPPGPGSTVHYLVADATGDCASVEFLEGRPVYHTGPTLAHPVLANDPYQRSVEFCHGSAPFGGSGPVPTDMGSLARFTRAANYVQRYDPADSVPAVDYVFSALASVSSGMFTKWSIVYDVPRRRIWLRTQKNQNLRFFNLGSFDLSGSSQVKMLDINARLSGDASAAFEPYTLEANRRLIFKVFRQVEFLKSVPDQALEQLARYPESTRYVGN